VGKLAWGRLGVGTSRVEGGWHGRQSAENEVPTSSFLTIFWPLYEVQKNSRRGRVKNEDVQVRHVSFFNIVQELRNYPYLQRGKISVGIQLLAFFLPMIWQLIF
jgi:hypothetical protein